MKNETLFNPAGTNRNAPKKETTKERNARRKEKARVKAVRAQRARNEVVSAERHEKHLAGRVMKDLERLYGKGYTRAASNMNYVLYEVEMFSTEHHHEKATY